MSKINIEYQPDLQVWSQDSDGKYIYMDNRRKYDNIDNQVINKIKINGQTYDIGSTTPQPYSIQTISVMPDDVILIHVAEDLDIDTINQIYDELQKSFPNNNILIANEYILKGLTIIKPQTGKVVVRQDITEDSLEKWLKKNVEFDI